MPTIAVLPGKIEPGSVSDAVVSTLDVFPTVLSLVNVSIPAGLDGVDISQVLFGQEQEYTKDDRVLFFWRDGFSEGPLPPPYGRLDIAAIKIGYMKGWFWTKSAHYNEDREMYHNPPLLFDVQTDPAESMPLNPDDHQDLLSRMVKLAKQHKQSIKWTYPLALYQDPQIRPCADPMRGCRTHDEVVDSITTVI